MTREHNTPLDEHPIREALGLYGLVSNELSLSPLHGGDDNLSIVVSVRSLRYVLRLYGVTARSEIVFELELIDFLATQHFPTPRVHRRVDGDWLVDIDGVPAALFDFGEGHPIDEADPGDVGRIAGLVARMHLLTSGVSFSGVRSRTDVGRLRRFAALVAAHADLARTRGVDDFVAASRAVLTDWETALESAHGSVRFGPIHHDPSPTNILVDQQGEITGLLDFDEAYLGYHVLDIAALLHYWALDTTPHRSEPLRSERVHQILHGYERVRPLTTAEHQLLPSAMLVFTAADAAEYLTRWWARDPDKVNLDTSVSVASFRALRDTTAWREEL